MKESIMHYLVLKILEDKNFEHANGRRMLDAWMKAKDLFESMSQEERNEMEKKITRKLL
tara:strand:+ start:27441 stop:27617 length:177 start_codon:yes stop_codon:yes gene_type:complete